jgi:putative transposase
MGEGKINYGRRKIVVENGIYHIIQRAPGIDILFLDEEDYNCMFNLLKNTARQFNLKLLAFAFLPNHIHLLVQISEPNLSEAMHSLFTRYAMYFNEKYKRKGHVFGSIYKAFLCLNDSYLITLSVYIHLNPIKAKLSNNIYDYNWSSLKYYLPPVIKNPFIWNRAVLSLFGEDINSAAQKYKELLEECVRIKGWSPILEKKFLYKFRMKVIKKISMMNWKSKIKSQEIKEEIELQKRMDKWMRKERRRKEEALETIKELMAQGYRVEDIASRLGVHKSTLYRWLAQ